ncbi:unannotated protein [freshwater metagenome]|uniref:Unannotated protein n=1 Tax=freshwater metagenome TaxID=449393 RepID=A0A6J6FFW7_9ZZZZ
MAQQNSKDGGGLRGLVIGMVVFVVAVGAAFTVISNKSNSQAKTPSVVSKADGYGIVFNPTGSPTIEIWEDFQCPVCAQFESINHSYIESLARGKDVKVVYYPLSFLGPESVLAANAAGCAAEEGKFLEFHRSLYMNQPAENSGAINATWLQLLGAGAGLTSNKYINCVTKGSYYGWVKNVAANGAKNNINSTPTVKVNGKELDRATQYMDSAAFKKAITDAGA